MVMKLFKFLEKKPSNIIEDLHPKEIGSTGVKNHAGYYDEEYLAKLTDLDGIDLYDEMRRSDAQIKMLLGIVKGPILSASWSVESVDDSDEEKEIAAFAEHVLFCDIGYSDGSKAKTFRQFVRESLTMLDFGHSVFEVVHKLVVDHPRFGTYHGLADLSWRSPKTIYEWHLLRNGSLSHIRQITEGDDQVDVNIPAKNLLVLTNDLEGSNFQGISSLRPIYGNHFRKTLYRKLQGIGIERCASGVPVGEIDDAMRNTADFSSQWRAFQKMLARFAANQQNYIALEKGFKVGELKLSHDPEKVQRVIDGENIEMTKAFLANFMELGVSGNSGSFSLGSDLSDMFLSSLQTIADEIAESLSLRVLKKIIRAKYGERDFFPKVVVTGVNDKAGKELAEVVTMLIGSGAIEASERLESYLHKRFKFPDIEREQEDDTEEELAPNDSDPENPTPSQGDDSSDKKAAQKLNDKQARPPPVKKRILSAPPIKARENAQKALNIYAKTDYEFSDSFIKLAQKVANGEELELPEIKKIAKLKESAEHFRPELKEDNGFPTQKTIEYLALGGDIGVEWAIELAANDTGATDLIKRRSGPLAKIMRTGLAKHSKDFRGLLLKSLKSNENRAKIFKVKVPNVEEYEKMLADFLIDVSDQAQKDVLKELNITKKLAGIDDLPKATRDRILAEIALLASTQFADIEKMSYFFFNQRIDSEESADDLIAELKRMHEAQIAKGVYDVAAVNAISSSVNGVRNDVFQEDGVLNDIESFIFTNPDPKSPICQHLTGRVFTKEEYVNSPFLPPLHHNCKSTIIAQTKGATNNLPVSSEGLKIEAKGEDKEKIIKSKTF